MATTGSARWTWVANPSAASPAELETVYVQFGRRVRPIATFVTVFVILYVADWIALLFVPNIVPWVELYGPWVPYVVPTLIIVFRGREFLPAILAGRLSLRGVAIVGIGVGAIVPFIIAPVAGFQLYGRIAIDLSQERIANEAFLAYALAPVAESLLYHAGIQTALQRFGSVAAVAGTTAIFVGVHMFRHTVDPMFFMYVLPSCFGYVLTRQITKSTGAAMLAHASYNFFVSAAYLPHPH
jgi:membrane protease YdiL (CAAX protease family)